MPRRELADQRARVRICDSGLNIEIRQQGATVMATLSGTLDRLHLSRLIQRLSPLLRRRGRRVVLDGRHLQHLDYRTVRPLIEWNQILRTFGHELLLYQWSDYLKAILSVEDWNRDLNPDPVPAWAWHSQVKPRPGRIT